MGISGAWNWTLLKTLNNVEKSAAAFLESGNSMWEVGCGLVFICSKENYECLPCGSQGLEDRKFPKHPAKVSILVIVFLTSICLISKISCGLKLFCRNENYESPPQISQGGVENRNSQKCSITYETSVAVYSKPINIMATVARWPALVCDEENYQCPAPFSGARKKKTRRKLRYAWESHHRIKRSRKHYFWSHFLDQCSFPSVKIANGPSPSQGLQNRKQDTTLDCHENCTIELI